VAVPIAAADQWVKAQVAAAVPPGASAPVIPGLLSLTHVQNRGVAFGLLAGAAPLALAVAALILVVILSYYRGRQFSSSATVAGIGSLVGGAAGNLVDRLRLGYVMDYLDVHIWPVFNLADAAITAGAGLLIVAFALGGRSTSHRR
jgi:signal peptidase II